MKTVVGMGLLALAAAQTKQCTQRGGCVCDCSWANPSTCGADDGSCCFDCCCGAGPGPGPSPGPSPTPKPNVPEYCPSADDLTVAYSTDNTPTLTDGGWIINGGGGVATKSSFNLLGGYVEYDIDFSGVPTGVNANLYTISPANFGKEFTQDQYCDGAATGADWCVEIDWIESNGNCGGATTIHTVEGPGNQACTAWGCRNDYHYNGRPTFHMRLDYNLDGSVTTTRDGQIINQSNMDPQPSYSDWSVLQQQYSERGAVLYSSQWVGWVPVEDCGTTGDLDKAHFVVKNLKIGGKVMQGPTPKLC